MPRIAIFQMTTGIDPAENAASIVAAIAAAKEGGACMLFTPEMCGLLDRDRTRASPHVVAEAENPVLAVVCDAAREHGVWVALGSLALAKGGDDSDGDDAWVNRSLVIDDHGEVVGRYDKMHMFDVDLANGESWRESNAYTAGNQVATVSTPLGLLGLTVCYDLRFPALFDALGRAECEVISIPAAFTVPTGRAHWHVLQRARAIEASAFVIAAAQVGQHEDGRSTYGHSLVVDPWGEVVLDMGEQEGLGFADVELGRVAEVRRQLPSLANRRDMPKSSPQ